MITTPYIVQCMVAKRPYKRFKGLKLSEALAFQPMVSNKVIVEAFTKLAEHRHGLRLSNCQMLSSRLVNVWVQHPFDEDNWSIYKDYISQMYQNTLELFKPISFDRYTCRLQPNSPNVWWDMQNSVIWSYDRQYMTEYLPGHLFQSFNRITVTTCKGQ